MTHNHKEIRRITKALIAQGFEVDHCAKGHTRVYKDGEFVTTTASTPSDFRGRRNFVADLRRAGFIWPVDSKRDRRAKR